jgi:two-component system phosphate regulon sensor histidine kinase PhoR
MIFLSTWKEENTAVFQVRDNGRGMTAQEQKFLFQLYYRTQGARESDIVGTGVGLYIVKSLVDAHHGQIHVASKPGHGTTFTVRLPTTQPVNSK